MVQTKTILFKFKEKKTTLIDYGDYPLHQPL